MNIIKTVIIDNKYLVTSDGKVFANRHNRWKEQKYRKHTNGYLRATINNKDEYVHRLVAKCFVPNPNGYSEVNHLDGNKENNNANNLEWCTRSQNNKHAFRIGLRSYDELNEMAQMPKLKHRRFTPEQVREIRKSPLSDTELAKKYGVARAVIYQIRKRKSYKEVI